MYYFSLYVLPSRIKISKKFSKMSAQFYVLSARKRLSTQKYLSCWVLLKITFSMLKTLNEIQNENILISCWVLLKISGKTSKTLFDTKTTGNTKICWFPVKSCWKISGKMSKTLEKDFQHENMLIFFRVVLNFWSTRLNNISTVFNRKLKVFQLLLNNI